MKYAYYNEIFEDEDEAIKFAESQIEGQELWEALQEYISAFGFWAFWNQLNGDLTRDIYSIARDEALSAIKKIYESEDEEEE